MSVRLITGDDSILISEAVSKSIDELVGDSDRALTVVQISEDDLRLPDGGWSLRMLLDAAQTAPFLTDRRVVVGRHLARFSHKGEVKSLVGLLASLLDTTDLVLVWERGVEPAMDGRMPALPKSLKEKVEAVGGTVTDVNPPKRKAEAGAWLRARIKDSGLRFQTTAIAALAELTGEDRSLVVGSLRTLEGALGAGATVTADDVATYGGDPGSAAPWDLDDAIDRGDISGAIKVLHRQLPSRHPFQVLAALHGRYQKILRLDGADVTDERQAAALLGMKAIFPARKMMFQARKLGSEKIARAIRLLAEADLALRGTVDWPHTLVLEVLVARLASLSSR